MRLIFLNDFHLSSEKKLTRKRIISSKEPICWLRLQWRDYSARAWFGWISIFRPWSIYVWCVRFTIMSVLSNFAADHMCKCEKNTISIMHKMTRTANDMARHWPQELQFIKEHCFYLVQYFFYSPVDQLVTSVSTANSNEKMIFTPRIDIAHFNDTSKKSVLNNRFHCLHSFLSFHCCQPTKPRNDERIRPTLHNSVPKWFLLLLLFVYTRNSLTHTHTHIKSNRHIRRNKQSEMLEESRTWTNTFKMNFFPKIVQRFGDYYWALNINV